MTRYLAVWDGSRPASDRDAKALFEDLYDRYIESGTDASPSPRIIEFVETILGRFPDLTDVDNEVLDESPWVAGPLLNEARGPFIYLGFVNNESASQAEVFAVAIAANLGLICFDPQRGELRHGAF